MSAEAEIKAKPYLEKISEIQRYNQQKIMAAFSSVGVSESHFAATTGYGHDDRGRDALDKVYAYAFGAEDALVRFNFTCGTHALTVALFGILRPNDKMLCVTGTPYDTIQGVIGMNGESSGSLKEFEIEYSQVELMKDGTLDYDAIKREVSDKYKVIYIQRSRGYSLRPSLFVKDIEKLVDIARKLAPHSIVMVDNCYGEFVEKFEPTDFGADLIVGSLIKNAGGGIAPTGGYIAGRTKYVDMCANRLTTPGTGKHIGSTLGHNRELFMGAFHAPNVTGEALKTAVFAAALFSSIGYEVTPKYDEPRADIIQAIMLQKKETLLAFCKGIQMGAPVDSFVTPVPGDMPGYDCDIIMAAGAFTTGASIELSADAPLREPYAVWLQGGLNYNSGQLGIILAANEMIKENIIEI